MRTAPVSGSGTKRQIASVSQPERRTRKRSRSARVPRHHCLAAKHRAISFHSSPWMIGFASIMLRRARSTEATDAFAPLRRAPSPRRYYDLGESSIVEWQRGVEDRDDKAARRFYTLRDLALRLEHEPAVPPSVLIFHCGRCGSTLLARLLESIQPTACSSSRRRCASSSTSSACNCRCPRRAATCASSSVLWSRPHRRREAADFQAQLPRRAFARRDSSRPAGGRLHLHAARPAEVVASLSRATPAFFARRIGRRWPQ